MSEEGNCPLGASFLSRNLTLWFSFPLSICTSHGVRWSVDKSRLPSRIHLNINPTVCARCRRCFPPRDRERTIEGRTKGRRKGKSFFSSCWANRKPTATVGRAREDPIFSGLIFGGLSRHLFASSPLPFDDFNVLAKSTGPAISSRVLTKILVDDFVRAQPHPHLKFHRSPRGCTRSQQRDASTLHRMQLRRVMIS